MITKFLSNCQATKLDLNFKSQNTSNNVKEVQHQNVSYFKDTKRISNNNNHEELQIINNRNISTDNIRILHYINTKQERNSFFIGSGGNAQVVLGHKLFNESITANLDTNKTNKLVNLKTNPFQHNIISISKLGVIKKFFLDDNTEKQLENTIYNAKHEIYHTQKMEISAKLFINKKTKEIDIISDYKGESLNDYISPPKTIEDNINCYDLPKLIIKQIIEQAMAFHKRTNCIHGDIKSSNIVVNQVAEAFLIDFGAASLMDIKGDVSVSNLCCTHEYLAPECFSSSFINGKKLDAWCIGLTFLQMIVKDFICFTIEYDEEECYFDYKSYKNTMNQVRKLKFIPPGIKDLIFGLLQYNPKKRFSLKEAFNLLNKDKEFNNLSLVELELEKHKSAKKFLQANSPKKRVSHNNIPNEVPILEFVN
jgi:serine/threonine protein kinase